MELHSLLGSWISVGSEIEDHETGSEIYHFFDPSVFLLEFQMDGQRSQISRSKFKATNNGFRYGSHESLPFEVIAWFEGEHMIWRPIHGMETWFTRIVGDEVPGWVRGHKTMK